MPNPQPPNPQPPNPQPPNPQPPNPQPPNPQLSIVLLIARKDLRQRLRDRSALILGFVAPLIIAALMSFAFKGTESYHVTMGVVDSDHGPVAGAFLTMLRSPDLADVVSVRTLPTVEQARREVDDGGLGAAIVIPAGFTAAAHDGPAVELQVLASVDSTIAGQLASSVTQAFTAQVSADRLSVATALASGAPQSSLRDLAEAAAKLVMPEQLVADQAGSSALTAIDYYGPAMGIFFMYFAIGFGARSFFAERRDGTLDRISAAPVRPWVVLAGKALSTFVYGVASLTTMALVTSLLFGADWGPPAAAAALIVAMGLTLVTITALVTVASRTERQAEGLASLATFGLVLLGGNFIVLAGAPQIMRTLALATPNGWALRAFTDLATGADAVQATALPLLAILAFAAVTGAAAIMLSRRAVLR